MADYGDQVTLARVYEKVSKKSGNTYFVGRIGLAKIALLRSKEMAENGDAIWNIVLSEGQSTDSRTPRGNNGADTKAPPLAVPRQVDAHNDNVDARPRQAAFHAGIAAARRYRRRGAEHHPNSSA